MLTINGEIRTDKTLIINMSADRMYDVNEISAFASYIAFALAERITEIFAENNVSVPVEDAIERIAHNMRVLARRREKMSTPIPQ